MLTLATSPSTRNCCELVSPIDVPVEGFPLVIPTPSIAAVALPVTSRRLLGTIGALCLHLLVFVVLALAHDGRTWKGKMCANSRELDAEATLNIA